MKVCFDARMYGLEHAGIGRYVKNLLDHLIPLDESLYLTLLVQPHIAKELVPHPRVSVIPVPIRHYSLSEQIKLPGILNRLNVNLFHFPHFNVPIFFNRPFVVTIHDILWHQVKGPSVTTLPPVLYYLKYGGYRLTVRHAVSEARAIFTPSLWVKDQLVSQFPFVSPQKIWVTYEAVDPGFQRQKAKLFAYKDLVGNDPFVVYTGSCYPHKNVPVVVDALRMMHQGGIPMHLIVVSSRNVFVDQLKDLIAAKNMKNYVHFVGHLPDSQVKWLYRYATALVHPSLSEGFGLTGIEAMSQELPVIAARSAALPEVYGDAALYFDPHKAGELANHLEKVTKDVKLTRSLTNQSLLQVKKYDWNHTARQTLTVYRQSM